MHRRGAMTSGDEPHPHVACEREVQCTWGRCVVCEREVQYAPRWTSRRSFRRRPRSVSAVTRTFSACLPTKPSTTSTLFTPSRRWRSPRGVESSTFSRAASTRRGSWRPSSAASSTSVGRLFPNTCGSSATRDLLRCAVISNGVGTGSPWKVSTISRQLSRTFVESGTRERAGTMILVARPTPSRLSRDRLLARGRGGRHAAVNVGARHPPL
jgi:hypothetical protein